MGLHLILIILSRGCCGDFLLMRLSIHVSWHTVLDLRDPLRGVYSRGCHLSKHRSPKLVPAIHGAKSTRAFAARANFALHMQICLFAIISVAAQGDTKTPEVKP